MLARKPADTPALIETLKRRIERDGPLTIEQYTESCLGDPERGYYATRDPFGAGGDFITAPEISQIFGELIGLWCGVVWQQMDSPAPLQLIELGPGRGTLMADALRAAAPVPDFREACAVHLVETSPALREVQAKTLKAAGAEAHWHDALDDVPAGASIVLANEFLDALPVRQFVRKDNAWHERCVGLSATGSLEFTLAATPMKDTGVIPHEILERAVTGDIAEIRPGVDTLMAALAARADRQPLAALVIDYGHAMSAPGDTFQAVKAHDHADPLAMPGEADLTAHVDFGQLGRAARGHALHAHGPLAQGAFLLALGLEKRCATLLENASAPERETIVSSARRLAEPDQMGALFKVMALTDDPLSPPAFADAQTEPRP